MRRAYLLKIKRCWIAVVFCLTISSFGFATIVLSGKAIIASVYETIRLESAQSIPKSSILTDAISSFEVGYNNNFIGKSIYIEFLGLFNNILRKKIILDSEMRYTVYKMENGQLTWNYEGYDIETYGGNYIKLAKNLQKVNIPLLYVQAPFKINKYDDLLPYGIKDKTNPMADEFLKIISSVQCDTFDLRERIFQDDFDYEDLFYKTDHHWKPETGLWATKVIVSEINSRYDINLNASYLEPEYYTYSKYKQYMLGSQGKRTGRLYSGLDDFIIIEPKYDTDYRMNIPSKKLIKEGCYSDVFLFWDRLKKDYYNSDPGEIYTGSNYPLTIIENKTDKSDTKILLVKDSFAKTVIPFLASTCKELHTIDLRSYDEMTISDYVSENDINIVVVLYNPSTVVDPSFYNF